MFIDKNPFLSLHDDPQEFSEQDNSSVYLEMWGGSSWLKIGGGAISASLSGDITGSGTIDTSFNLNINNTKINPPLILGTVRTPTLFLENYGYSNFYNNVNIGTSTSTADLNVFGYGTITKRLTVGDGTPLWTALGVSGDVDVGGSIRTLFNTNVLTLGTTRNTNTSFVNYGRSTLKDAVVIGEAGISAGLQVYGPTNIYSTANALTIGNDARTDTTNVMFTCWGRSSFSNTLALGSTVTSSLLLDCYGTSLFRNTLSIGNTYSGSILFYNYGLSQFYRSVTIGNNTSAVNLIVAGSDTYPAYFQVDGSGSFARNVTIHQSYSLLCSKMSATSGTYITVNSPLYVSGSASRNESFRYYAYSGTGGPTSGTNSYGIVCTNRILASEFNANSSIQIKDIISDGKDVADESIDFIKKIPFYKYRYKDTIKHGDHDCYGVIAEKVAEILPGYVSENEEFVPNLMKKSTLLKRGDDYEVECEGDWEHIKGDRLLILLENEKYEGEIISRTSNKFSVKIKEKEVKTGECFLYGTYLESPTVAKNKLFEMGLVALQYLLKNDIVDRIKKLELDMKNL